MMSLSQLAKRYDILRTQFYTEWKEQPLQIVLRHKPIETVVEDIRDMNVDQRSEFIAALREKIRSGDSILSAML